MGLRMLIAVLDQAQREQLCVIYSNSPLVTRIEVATSSEELYYKLENMLPDFVVVHQPWITNIALLPKGHCIILAKEPDWHLLIAVCKHGIRGYFLENPLPLEALLITSLTLKGREWSLDPRLTSLALHYAPPAELPLITEILSTREQQILVLWNKHLSSRIIGEQLNISEGTVKKHLEHIREKLHKHDASELMR